MNYSETSPLGQFYSWDTEFDSGKMFILIFDSNPASVQGTPALVLRVSPEWRFHCKCFSYFSLSLHFTDTSTQTYIQSCIHVSE